MSETIIAAPVIAGAVAAARAFLRMEAGAAEEPVLARLAATAIALGEAFTGTVFVRRGCEDVLAAGAAWQPLAAGTAWQPLAAMPVVAIAGATGLVAGGAPFVLAADTYAIDIDRAGVGWVRVIRAGSGQGAAERVAVAYRAGLAETWETLPAPIAQGVVALITHLFDDRGGGAQPPAAVAALWRPYRRMRLMSEIRA